MIMTMIMMLMYAEIMLHDRVTMICEISYNVVALFVEEFNNFARV